jgi:hypothetical protein
MKNILKNRLKNILDHQVSKIVHGIDQKLISRQKIVDYLSIEATKKTTQYILENCSNAVICNSKLDLYNFIVEMELISEQYFEFGVWKAESINFFSTKFPKSHFFGFDSFEGLPENWRPGFAKGEFSLGGVLPKVNNNVTLVPGWFNVTLPIFIEEVEIRPNLFIHIDCDLYSSTKDVFNVLGSKFQGKIYILFDEYFNYPFWEHHEFKAFKELIDELGFCYEYIAINIDHEQVLVKIEL